MPDDQTPDEWLTIYAVSSNPEASGTGLFLFPGPAGKAILPDLTYEGCIRKADQETAKAFKWVPHVIASIEEIQATRCGDRCNRRCIKPGCICDRDAHICS